VRGRFNAFVLVPQHPNGDWATLSAGGYGAWEFSQRFPATFAAFVEFSGGGTAIGFGSWVSRTSSRGSLATINLKIS
jgi:hypothetical protein